MRPGCCACCPQTFFFPGTPSFFFFSPLLPPSPLSPQRSWPTLAKPTLARVRVLKVWPSLAITEFGFASTCPKPRLVDKCQSQTCFCVVLLCVVLYCGCVLCWSRFGRRDDSPRAQNVHISGPRRFKHHQNSTKGPPREGRKKVHCGGRGKKNPEIFGFPPFGAPRGSHPDRPPKPTSKTLRRHVGLKRCWPKNGLSQTSRCRRFKPKKFKNVNN